MFAAISCVATMLAIPVTANGYIHPGDSAVLLSAYLCGPVGGCFAAGIGSALADIFLGYAYYAPGTFVIKLLDALLAGFVFLALKKSAKIPTVISSVIAGIAGSIVMILGYFFYSFLLLGDGFAAAVYAIPANILQAITGIALSSLVYEILRPHAAKFFE